MGPTSKEKDNLLVNVKINENNEIELMELEENTQDTILIESNEINLDDPEIVQTEDGRLLIAMKKKSTQQLEIEPQYACEKCDKEFKNSAAFDKHAQTCRDAYEKMLIEKMASDRSNLDQPSEDFQKYYDTNPENPCYCCGEDISTAHVGHIKCQLCPKSFKIYGNLEQHLQKIHSDSFDFACAQCNARCDTKETLDQHYTTHLSGKPFSCLRCGKDFTRKYHLDRHLNHTACDSSKEKTMLPCEVCKREFSRIDNLREHLRGHMGEHTRKRDYQCPFCEKSFYGSSLLNIHIRTHTGEKPFPCDLCQKCFPSNGALRKHRRMHTGERPYSCQECGASFSAKETLNRHNKIHSGDKPHICNICGKSFIQATQLRAHQFHHDGENGFECDKCGRNFNRKIRLNEHIRFLHNGEKPLPCDECPKTFKRKEDLNRHKELHTGLKNYVCEACDKKFATKASLKLHLRIHTAEEKVACKECKKTFIRMDCLIRHMRKYHREKLLDVISEAENKKIERMKKIANGELIEEYEETEVRKNDNNITLEDGEIEVLEEHIEDIDGEQVRVETYKIVKSNENVEDQQIIEIDQGQLSADDETINEVLAVDGEIYQISDVQEIDLGNAVIKELPQSSTSTATTKQHLSIVPIETDTNINPTPTIPNQSIQEQSNGNEEIVFAAPQSNALQLVISSARSLAKLPKIKKEKSPTKPKIPKQTISKSITVTEAITETDTPIFLNDTDLKKNVAALLRLLIEDDILTELGFGAMPVEEVLSSVIQRCGHKSAVENIEETGDCITRMRENTKLLFSLTMDDDYIKSLLNNHTVDEVIVNVLKSQ
uniref:Putative gonadotropin inducible transcription factor n=1 Tax=Corethrella appendiculata TaxID=1370023 RepID=U5EU65_9DIPT